MPPPMLCYGATSPPRNITSPPHPLAFQRVGGVWLGGCQRTTADGEVGESISFLLMGWKLESFCLVGKRESVWILIAFYLTKNKNATIQGLTPFRRSSGSGACGSRMSKNNSRWGSRGKFFFPVD